MVVTLLNSAAELMMRSCLHLKAVTDLPMHEDARTGIAAKQKDNDKRLAC